jgi:hypothetical protein
MRMRTLLEQPIDWGNLLAMATAHGVLPLLYWQLTQGFRDAVPESIFQELHNVFHRHALNNLYLTGELLKALDLCKAHGIAALPFKGLTLAACAYGNLALRDLVDLDLFLRVRDLAKTVEVLLGEGYRPTFPLNRLEERAHLYELLFVHKDGAGMVELHTAFLPGRFTFALDFERVWKHRVTLSLGGQSVPSLSPEDLLLVLCVHGCKHLWVCLKWICDIAFLAQNHPTLNWPYVREEAHRLGSERMLLLGLGLARDLLHAPLPKDIWQKIQTDVAVKSLGAQVTRKLFLPPEKQSGGFESILFHLKARERMRDRVRYCLSLAIAPTFGDWDSVNLPSFLSFLYYVLRPVRLAGKYGRRLGFPFLR